MHEFSPSNPKWTEYGLEYSDSKHDLFWFCILKWIPDISLEREMNERNVITVGKKRCICWFNNVSFLTDEANCKPFTALKVKINQKDVTNGKLSNLSI